MLALDYVLQLLLLQFHQFRIELHFDLSSSMK